MANGDDMGTCFQIIRCNEYVTPLYFSIMKTILFLTAATLAFALLPSSQSAVAPVRVCGHNHNRLCNSCDAVVFNFVDVAPDLHLSNFTH